MNSFYDVIIIGTGPSGLGAAFHLSEHSKKSILIVDKLAMCSGGLLNDCKQNYTWPVGFNTEFWNKEQADEYLEEVARYLKPSILPRNNINVYSERAKKYGAELLEIQQYHVGTDKAKYLIQDLMEKLKGRGVHVSLKTDITTIDYDNRKAMLSTGEAVGFKDIVFSVGRKGASWIQEIFNKLDIKFIDNVIDIGIRVEMKQENYPIVKDFYDPKFYLPNEVRTFCTNSGAAFIVQEKYDVGDKHYFSVNGHGLSSDKPRNGLVNFALLKTIKLTNPITSATEYGYMIGQNAMIVGGGRPIMQRVGDLRARKRSKVETFNHDLYDFKPTLGSATPGDITMAMPAKIFDALWSGLKTLDKIIPGTLHPSNILYFPEIKTYTSKPVFIDEYFQVKENVYACGDATTVSRGITGAWASGARAAKGILNG